MDYKKDEIKEYFDDYIKENKEWFEENESETWKDDLHHHAFNEDYYIIGTYQAKEWLGNMAFGVINFIKDYEQDNFGKIYTDFSEPEKVVNMYVYILGEEIVADYLNELEEVA
jgi:5-methylthioribose kinase